MATQMPEGHLGNLTPEQEAKVRQLWETVFKLYKIYETNGTAAPGGAAPVKEEVASPKPDPPQKKSRFGFFRRGESESKPANGTASDASLTAANGGLDVGIARQLHELLDARAPEAVRAMVLGAVKHDHPDVLALRFLRARKWDIEKSLLMMFTAIKWRSDDAHVDDDIMLNGEEAAVREEKTGDKALGHDFMKQMRMGKSILHGTDRENRPINIVRARLHKASDQSVESIERYTTYLIETARFALDAPVETANLIFDMTGFTLANMDYVPVKFIIKCFESNYPESLGVILIHNAPWVFKGIWTIIHGWLDAVVAAKVNFTYGREGLEKFIAPDQLIKELGGDEDWEYRYVEPVPGENDRMKDVATRDRLAAARDDLARQFEAATQRWIDHPDGAEAAEAKAERDRVAAQLRDSYWQLDPYVRARSLYDRQGNIRGGAPVHWYGEPAPVVEKAPVVDVETVPAVEAVKSTSVVETTPAVAATT